MDEVLIWFVIYSSLSKIEISKILGFLRESFRAAAC